MTSYSLFNLCVLDTDIPPGDGRAAVLQKVLNQHDIMPRSVINVRSVPLAERVGADIGQPQKVTHGLEIALYDTNLYREQKVGRFDVVGLGVVAEEGVNRIGDGKVPFLPGLLLGDVQTVTVPVFHDVGQPQPENVTDPHSQVGLGYQNGSTPGVGSQRTRPLPHGRNDQLVLFCREGLHYIASPLIFRSASALV